MKMGDMGANTAQAKAAIKNAGKPMGGKRRGPALPQGKRMSPPRSGKKG